MSETEIKALASAILSEPPLCRICHKQLLWLVTFINNRAFLLRWRLNHYFIRSTLYSKEYDREEYEYFYHLYANHDKFKSDDIITLMVKADIVKLQGWLDTEGTSRVWRNIFGIRSGSKCVSFSNSG